MTDSELQGFLCDAPWKGLEDDASHHTGLQQYLVIYVKPEIKDGLHDLERHAFWGRQGFACNVVSASAVG